MSNQAWQWIKRAVVASTVASTMFFAVATVAASSAAAQPTLTEIPAGSGTHGYAYDAVPQTPTVPGAPFVNLSEVGYAEREFTMSGGATIYKQSGFWSSNGKWGVSPSQTNVPYTTRLLVRYPTNPAKFNGTVVFEWLNDTTGGDQDPVWAQLYNQLISKGYAYVGVTAQSPGMKDLATWDPARYGTLGDSNDGESYDIFTQAAEAVKADSATLLGGLTPKELIGTGDSQSAFRVDTYVNAIQPLTHAFNGFLAVGRGATAAPIGEGLVATSPFPALIRTDNTAPFIQLNTQGDIEELDAAAARQPDNNDLRTWEAPGRFAHRRTRGGLRDRDDRSREPDPGSPPLPARHADRGHRDRARRRQPDRQHAAVRGRGCGDGSPTELGHQRRSAGAQPADLDVPRVLRSVLPREQEPVRHRSGRDPDARRPGPGGELLGDQLRVCPNEQSLSPPAITAELEDVFTTLETGGITNEALRDSGLCLLSGYFTDLSQLPAEIAVPTTASYASKFASAANAEVAAGFMTPEDAAAAIANANAGIGPLQQPPVTIP